MTLLRNPVPKKYRHFDYQGFSIGILSAPSRKRAKQEGTPVLWRFTGRIYRPDDERIIRGNKVPFQSEEGDTFAESESAIAAALKVARWLIDSGRAERDLPSP